VLTIVLVCGIPLLIIGTALYRKHFHVWPGQSLADRIHWCGRDYDKGPHDRTIEQIGLLPSNITVVLHSPPLPPRHPVYAEGTQAQIDAQKRKAGFCSFGLYVKTGKDRYRPYVLQGGP
jgi:hypothetical protein